ncbi:MAG: right-handed parallel beta-helix repeat-containing protein, partial [Flavobacteriaceae bacterium]|nr:right-handed parallel beta-helix repeat-containing protein [Flavobacteriaceae bacterium]MCY4267478.1 right-handed parallel beta-helix repeat-containing protein [Flavobacteriaceae bacterium]
MLALLTIGSFPYSQEPTHLYVSPYGNDSHNGTINNPFRTIRKAQSTVRKIESGIITVFLRGGTYRLENPLRFSHEDSGSKIKKIIYQSFGDEIPIIKGSEQLNLKWKNAGKGLVKASIAKNISFERLFINGKKQILARYPNFQKEVTPYNGWAADAIAPERVAQWKKPKGGYLHALHGAQWGGYHWLITGVDENGEAILEGGWQNNRPERGVHKTFRFVENIKEELDTINEWYLDHTESTLYWMPDTDDDLNHLVVEVPQLKHLIEIIGTETSPIENLHFKGIHFQHTTRTFMDSKDRLLRSDWAIYRGGAILVHGAKNISISYCHLEDLGGNAIFFDGYVRKSTVASNRMTRIGASGISFVGNASSVRSPNYAYQQYTTYTELDTIVGPKNNQYPADNLVYDNLIFELGQIEKQTAGIQIAMAMDITVRHNSIYHAPRAGINIGDGNWGGHIIEYNDVFDTVRETSDHGSFNSWGRD